MGRMHVLAAPDGRGGRRLIEDEKQRKVQLCPGWLPTPGACHVLRSVSSPVRLTCLTCSASASPSGGGKGDTSPWPPLLNHFGDRALSFILGFLEIPN